MLLVDNFFPQILYFYQLGTKEALGVALSGRITVHLYSSGVDDVLVVAYE